MESKMITYRVCGWWCGPIVTVWTTKTEEQFNKYCEEQGFIKNGAGAYIQKDNPRTRLEIQ